MFQWKTPHSQSIPRRAAACCHFHSCPLPVPRGAPGSRGPLRRGQRHRCGRQGWSGARARTGSPPPCGGNPAGSAPPALSALSLTPRPPCCPVPRTPAPCPHPLHPQHRSLLPPGAAGPRAAGPAPAAGPHASPMAGGCSLGSPELGCHTQRRRSLSFVSCRSSGHQQNSAETSNPNTLPGLSSPFINKCILQFLAESRNRHCVA